MSPLSAHVAHIGHLARPAALEQLLADRHEVLRKPARRLAADVAPFLEQALHFHEVACRADVRVRPVLQYYAYLNFAVAVVLIYKPPGWEQYRKHGAEDLSRTLKKLSLSSPIVQMRPGAVPLFHSVISSAPASTSRLTLRDLLVQIPMVALELNQTFGIRPLAARVTTGLQESGEAPNQRIVAYCHLNLIDPANAPTWSPGNATLPTKRFQRAIPELGSRFRVVEKQPHLVRLESTQHWTPGNRDRAERFLEETTFKACNFGGQQVNNNLSVEFMWRFERSSQILPTLTAALLLSFCLASLSRYRANVVNRVDSSKINLLCEVFASEADGFMIPAFRNLLYAETMYVHASTYT